MFTFPLGFGLLCQTRGHNNSTVNLLCYRVMNIHLILSAHYCAQLWLYLEASLSPWNASSYWSPTAKMLKSCNRGPQVGWGHHWLCATTAPLSSRHQLLPLRSSTSPKKMAQCPIEDNLEVDHSRFFSQKVFHWDAHRIGWATTIGAACFATVLTLYHIFLIWRTKDTLGRFVKSTL